MWFGGRQTKFGFWFCLLWVMWTSLFWYLLPVSKQYLHPRIDILVLGFIHWLSTMMEESFLVLFPSSFYHMYWSLTSQPSYPRNVVIAFCLHTCSVHSLSWLCMFSTASHAAQSHFFLSYIFCFPWS